MHIGILSAMPEEVGHTLTFLKNVRSTIFGDLQLFTGEYQIRQTQSILITIAWSGWGKVSAARATTRLLGTNISNKKIDLVLFTGVAGAVDKKLKQWDIVVSDAVIQHDMDARPIFDKFVVPAINSEKIYPRKNLIKSFYEFTSLKLEEKEYKDFGKIHKGLIGTGDMFISDEKKIKQLLREIPGLLAVEMEGGAFAQVAFQEKIDWLVIRVISDGADESAHDDFNLFLEKYKIKSWLLVKCFLESLLLKAN